ncbi:hypothetical protein [Marinifilum flexuosum]|uniref:Uncharacterized protein n=1 Tax=Marinifilum flexuosum TaxID=1117708 RepID=A0A419WMR4_9BACT|nr:hypothetical protein [Marinifilum flexuosum]RKD96765.1 hypothetical protein BXY64_3711 [Marinifilum flexuosum]
MKRKLEDYRIKEENGEFIIQRKEVIIERLGFLKLKKTKKVFWRSVSSTGGYLGDEVFFNNIPAEEACLKTFKTLGEAIEKLKEFIPQPTYYYLTD